MTNWHLNFSLNRAFGELKIDIKDGSIKLLELEIGLGELENLTHNRLRRVIHKTVRVLRSQRAIIQSIDLKTIKNKFSTDFIITSLLEANYVFNKYSPNKFPIADFSHLKTNLNTENQIILNSINFCKDLINEPANIMTPLALAEAAQKLSTKNLQVKILNSSECQDLGLNTFLAVSRGASAKPYLIEFTYNNSSSDEYVGLIGKGLTYDTGGLSLKPNKYMYGMKSDMSGAAVIMGIFKALSELNWSVSAKGLILACENSFDANSFRPGDIIKTLSGKTVEIVDTDAEGRLVLADALTYFSQQKEINKIIDYATLTGSCAATLGDKAAGAFTNNNSFLQEFGLASASTGEEIWQLPMFEEYKTDLESSCADLLQCAGRPDASLAALFLQEFIIDKKPWLHLDIAGIAYLDEKDDYYEIGPTGWGIWSTLQYLNNCSNTV